MASPFQQKSEMKVALKLTKEGNPEDDKDKSLFITIELKCQAGNRSTNTPTYKKHIRTFENGSPQEFVVVRQAIEEVWRQNSVTAALDRENTIRMLLKGDSYTMYEAHRSEAIADGTPLTVEIVDQGLAAVAIDVFPHRALFYQKRWMQNGIRKPRALTTRQMVAALIKINNSLPLFPGATEADKFSEQELLQIMEWMIPQEFCQKFEEKGYIPTEHTRKRFIEESEIVERYQLLHSKTSKPEKPLKQRRQFNKGKGKNREKSQGKYCTHHGSNKGHDSADCWTLHPELKPNNTKGPKMSNNKMKKEINALARSSNKSELEIVQMKLDQLNKAKEGYAKKAKAKEHQLLEKNVTLDNSSDSISSASSTGSERSLQMNEKDPIPRKKKFVEVTKKEEKKPEKKRKAITLEDVSPDEAAFLKKKEAFKKMFIADYSPEEQDFQKKAKDLHNEVDLSKLD